MIKKQPIYGSKQENSGETGEITFKKSTKKHPVAKVTPYGVWSVWSSHIQISIGYINGYFFMSIPIGFDS